jgi:DNA invertase Pin-like site-specific DNA recombinase
MSTTLSPSKIRPEHLDRQALIYVRQSTAMQMRNHTGSTRRQYDLHRYALDLGWTQQHIEVIDHDQGHTGKFAAGRDGFQYILSQVALGKVGAVFSLEASRLARANSDWFRLIEICALTETLVIDEDGVYDPNQFNDRIILGFKGNMSEAEIHFLRARMEGAKLAKAMSGDLRLPLPTGWVYDAAGRTVFDADEEIQNALRLLFELFERLGSARSVVQYFAAHHLKFPRRLRQRGRCGELVWEPLHANRVLAVLHNPGYAGIYAYGQTKSHTRPQADDLTRLKTTVHRIPFDQSLSVLRDHHPGYISAEQFQANRQRLDQNRTARDPDHDRRGAVREGAALLQGIARCGSCGRRMVLAYKKGASGSHYHVYQCSYKNSQRAQQACQAIRGDQVDAAVAQAFLEAIEPAQIEVSLAALDQVAAAARRIDQQWQRSVERARYEADLVRRRYLGVDPDNRLVARNLERDWNEKLTELERLERESSLRPGLPHRLVDSRERAEILALARDLPGLWNAATTTNVQRKQLLGFLIKDVTLERDGTVVRALIRWQTEACTLREIPYTKWVRGYDARRTEAVVVERVRELAATLTDRRIAEQLNREGSRRGEAEVYTGSKIYWIRYINKISTCCPESPSHSVDGTRDDGRCSAEKAAELLRVSIVTIAKWCRSGHLDGIQAVPGGPWWIKLKPECIERLRRPMQPEKPGNP